MQCLQFDRQKFTVQQITHLSYEMNVTELKETFFKDGEKNLIFN